MRSSIDTTGLPQPLIETIESMIRAYRESHPDKQTPQRQIGWARETLPELPDAFFDDLPDDLLGFFEGKAA